MNLLPFFLALAVSTPPGDARVWNGPVSDSERYVTAAPFTYVIGYSDWLADEALMESLRESPPDLLHINQPVPVNHMLGLTGNFWDWHPTLISQEAYREKTAAVKRYIQALRDAGAELIIPYINTSIMLGDHEKRTGFWEMYDRWEQWSWLNAGPKPARDPLLWCGVPRKSLDPWKPYPEYDLWRYEPSLGDPDWRRFQLRCVEELASCGYDGLFADDCIMASYAPTDQDRFAGYIASRPSGGVLAKHSLLGLPGQGLRYAETVRYWQDTTAEHLEAMLEAARKHNPDFFIVPNWGSISRPAGLVGRERSGKSLGAWSRVSRLMMLEENYGPGRIAPGAIHDYALQFKQCLAHGVRPALLPYLKGEKNGTMAYAEIAASGGGAFVEPFIGYPGLRKSYRALFHGYAEYFDGLKPWSQVGLLYDTDETHFENDVHIYDGMRMARALLDSHIQFDVILKKDLLSDRLRQYETVILPSVSRLSDRACKALLSYAEDGGHLVVTGDTATHDELDRERPRHQWGLSPWVIRGMGESSRQTGAGFIDYAHDTGRLLPASPIDVEMLADVMPDGIEAAVAELCGSTPITNECIHPFWLRLTGEYAENHLSAKAPPEVRVHVFERPDGAIVLHLVHYCVSPWEPDDSAPPTPLESCRVDINLDGTHQYSSAFGLDAIGGRSEVKFSLRDSWISLEVSNLGYHRMIVLQ